MSRGLFVGRFQPFHLGHIAAIMYAFDKVEELIIVIGSSQKSHEIRNPFTAGERILMIKQSLSAEEGIDIGRVLVIPVTDTNSHPLWTYHLDNMVPKYELVFSNDSLTCLLYKERGTMVIQPPLHRREELSGTEIRSRIAHDKDWKNLVTSQTARLIDEVHGAERIKAIVIKDTGLCR